MIIQSFPYSYSPFDVFRNFKYAPYSAFLLSGIKNPRWGRYSFLTAFPYMVFQSKGKNITLVKDRQKIYKTGNPFNILRRLYSEHSGKQNLLSSLPFTGGMLGYFAYDMGFTLEKILPKATDDLKLPDCIMPFYDWVLYWDHKTKESFVLWIDTPKDKREKIRGLLNKSTHSEITENTLADNSLQLKSNFKKEDYLKAIVKAKDYIKKGDIFQVNLSQRFSCSYNASPFELFENLAFINPAPFSAFLNFPEVAVISSSPERFLYLNRNKIHTRPVKGTRKRGKNKEEDKFLAKELLSSAKDRAELIMIVDLERNDLGKFCYYGSVHVHPVRNSPDVTSGRTISNGVKELVELETHPTVFHTVSTIQGNVVDGITPVDCVKYCFPGGSITGAPKVRSMEIIEELEPTRRNIYTGAIGYISFNRRMDLNIVIRTIIIKDKTAYFQVGGGIVADSVPELEYEETLHKGKALAQSLVGTEKLAEVKID